MDTERNQGDNLMKNLFAIAAWFCVFALLGSLQLSYAQTPDQTATDKTSQLANDFCSQLSLAQASGQTTADKTSQLANDFCSQLSLAQASGQPVQLALARTSSQPTSLALAQTSTQPTRLAAAQVPGQQPADKTVQLADDLHFTIGFRTWFNSWTSPGKIFAPGFGALDYTNDGIGYIPTAGLRYKDFFISASGFFANDYSADLLNVGPPLFLPASFDQHSKRKEVDVNAGYYIHPWIALSAGYKHIGMDFTVSGIPSSVLNPQYSYNGPTLGAAVSIPIPEGGLLPSGLTVYGNGAGGYLWTHGNTGGSSSISNHAFYSVLEGGLAYKFARLPIALTGGYKFQALNMIYKDSGTSRALSGRNSQTDVMRGPILGISYIH
jgi:hypothetical protein